MNIEKQTDNAIQQFAFKGNFIEKKIYGSGHINTTFCLVYDENGATKKYILQKINDKIFKNTDELMKNIEKVTKYLSKLIEKNGGDPKRETLSIIKTKNGELYYNGGFDNCFRAYEFIENATTYDLVKDKKDFYESAISFGNFQYLLKDFNADTLYEIIPNFHNTVSRLDNLKKSIEKNPLNRVKNIEKEIQFILKREDDCHIICDALAKGKIPLRVTHNDTKLNNIMIDNITKKGLCVVDLDTIMPGTLLNDYGDSIRFGASTGLEDEKDLSKIECCMELFEAYTKGFLEGLKGNVTDEEKRLFPMGAKLMTLECGIRFLTDYIDGDIYFNTHYKEHNLDRARTQLKLVQDMENKWDIMVNIVKKYS